MGGFLGSPWNFIFLEEFGAAGGARISLNSLCGDMERSHSPPTRPTHCHHAFAGFFYELRRGQTAWNGLAIPTCQRLTQEDPELVASLESIIRLSLKQPPAKLVHQEVHFKMFSTLSFCPLGTT